MLLQVLDLYTWNEVGTCTPTHNLRHHICTLEFVLTLLVWGTVLLQVLYLCTWKKMCTCTPTHNSRHHICTHEFVLTLLVWGTVLDTIHSFNLRINFGRVLCTNVISQVTVKRVSSIGSVFCIKYREESCNSYLPRKEVLLSLMLVGKNRGL